MRWRSDPKPGARLTPPPKRISVHDHESCAGGVIVSAEAASGLIARAASARRTPWPIFLRVSAEPILGVDFAADENRARRTASIRIQGFEYCCILSKCSASHRAAAA